MVMFLSEEEDCPVSEEVCKARMDAQMAWVKATFAGAMLTIALIIVQVARGH
jgi:hypothetical protein